MMETTNWQSLAESLVIEGRAFVGGEYVDAQSGKTFDTVNPATGKVLAKIASCDAADVDLAVMSGRLAFESGVWSRKPPQERKEIMMRFAGLIRENLAELALLETLDVGKPISNSVMGDIPGSAACIEWYAEAIDKVYGEVGETPPNLVASVWREPLGVVAAVVPWNFPLLAAVWKIAPALATGNSVIVKPAEQSPLTAIRIGQLALDAGVPAGVLNIVPGLGETAGKALGLHMEVDCVTFTGSTQVGKYFLRYAADSNAKRVSLELGGKSPHIVLADTEDLDQAAAAIVEGIFFNAGQVCSAGSRLIVEESIKEELLAKIVKLTRALEPGDPLDPKTELGALVSAEQLVRVRRYIESGISSGAEVVIGGEAVRIGCGGSFFLPTILDSVNSSMEVAQEEIFGPVLTVLTAKDFDDAIELANSTIYGLAAGVWTSNVTKAHRAAKAIRSGVVWVNCYEKGSLAVPFGGFKQSGFGRDKSLHAMDKYTDYKAVWFAI